MNGSGPVRIPVNVDLAELDALLNTIPNCGRVIDDRGFTVYDVCARRRIKRSHASFIVQQLLKNGNIRHIGRRPGRNGAKVFEIVQDAPGSTNSGGVAEDTTLG